MNSISIRMFIFGKLESMEPLCKTEIVALVDIIRCLTDSFLKYVRYRQYLYQNCCSRYTDSYDMIAKNKGHQIRLKKSHDFGGI